MVNGSSIAGLGRVPHFDPKNLDYLISDVQPVTVEDRKIAILAARGDSGAETVRVPASLEATPQLEKARTSKYWNDSAWWGDQGDAPACTAFALCHAMADGPVTHPGQNPLDDPMAVYAAIVARDRAAGRYYADGATSLAMAQEAVARGWIGEFRWGYTLADALAALDAGPILLGIDWYEGMDYPDKAYGIIRATGRIRGGHEIECNGKDLAKGFVRVKQSWTRRLYGKNGHAYMPLEDLETLIADGGDVLQFRELRTDDPRTKRDERVG